MFWLASTYCGDKPILLFSSLRLLIAHQSIFPGSTSRCSSYSANTTGSSNSNDSGEESGWESAKRRMEDFITRHGFVAIWALATFPSGAFDLCGVCCGQLRVPFKVEYEEKNL